MNQNSFYSLLCLTVFLGCSVPSSDLSNPADTLNDCDSCLVKMVTVPSKGQTGYLGMDSTTVPTIESPLHAFVLQHDFQISKYEITIDAYYHIMGHGPRGEAIDTTDTLALRHPQSNVSYWDAVLFCNRLSEREGLEPVYTYLAVDSSANGSIQALEGLETDYSKNGYRLPVEAEWEYVARAGGERLYSWPGDSSSASLYAWYSSNAGGVAHPVGQLAANEFGVFDMAGNLKEWVDGWLGSHVGAGAEDPVGATYPNFNEERIVKGGSYLDAVFSLRATARKDVYPVASGFRSSTLGFRVARGCIGKPHWTSDTTSSNPSTAHVVTARAEVLDFLQARRARLAVVDAKNESLLWIDFKSKDLRIHVISDSLPIRHPSISPDGRWVAYATRMEGQSGVSKMVVRRLDETGSGRIVQELPSAAIPRWWVSSAQDTFLVYVSSPKSNDDSLVWSQERTYRQRFSQGAIIGAPEEISGDAGAFHGGLSDDGNLLATGSTRLLVRNRGAGATQARFLSPQNGKDSSGSSQVCNVSLSRGSPAQMLFLDFGYPRTSSIVGRSYGVHEYLFVASSDGAVQKYIPVPSGFVGWDHTEWSNDSTLAVGCGFDSREERSTVFAIDMEKQTTIPLLNQSDFLHPSLWIDSKRNDNSLSDSLLVYSEVLDSYWTWSREYKTALLWESCDTATGYVIGSSRHSWDIRPSYLPDAPVINLAMAGHDLIHGLHFLEQYVLPNAPKLDHLILGADLDLLAEKSPGWWEKTIAPTKGYQLDANHGFWTQGRDSAFLAQVVRNKPVTYSPFYDPALDGGEVATKWFGWMGDSYTLALSSWWSYDTSYFVRFLDTLDLSLSALDAAGIRVYLVQMPISPYYAKNGKWATFGPATYAEGIFWNDRLAQVVARHPNSVLIDFHKNGNHDFVDSEAADDYHLNVRGATRLSQMLNDSIKHYKPLLQVKSGL